MQKEIVTDPLSVEDLWSDLRMNIDMLKQAGVRQVLLLFGFSWGNFIYTAQWKDMAVSVDAVEGRILDAEKKGYGMLGDDNLYVTIPEFKIRLQYSHETDIHISYSESNAFVDALLERWMSNQWFLERPKR